MIIKKKKLPSAKASLKIPKSWNFTISPMGGNSEGETDGRNIQGTNQGNLAELNGPVTRQH